MGLLSQAYGWFARLVGIEPAVRQATVDLPLELVREPADISRVGIHGYEELIGACMDVEARGQESPWYEPLRQAAREGLTFEVPLVMGLEAYPPQDQVLRAQVVGFLHDVVAEDGSRAAITCLARHALPEAYRMNDDPTNEGGWRSSRMRRFHTRFLLGLFPKHLRRAVKPVRKLTATGPDGEVVATADALWLPSASELFGADLRGGRTGWERRDCARDVLPREGEQFPYLRDLGVTWGSWDRGCDEAHAAMADRNLTNGAAAAAGATDPEVYWLRSASWAAGSGFLCADGIGRVQERVSNSALPICVGFSL